MTPQAILFCILAIIAIVAAIMVIIQKNPIKSILWLLVVFFALSAIYFSLNAQFLAIINLIVYAGAIMVLFLFVLMLINFKSLETIQKKYRFVFYAVVIVCGVLTLLMLLINQTQSLQKVSILNDSNNVGLIENLGKTLYLDYGVPFELTSILFLTAIIGAVLLSKIKKIEI
ncbi:MAG: NADH-quinone oxidoreductase subunit J [Alphaproteobacteria bacterium]|nr:NADH-quinone oxidoreductase subunit J [Alphaproteobacteria bacterium]